MEKNEKLEQLQRAQGRIQDKIEKLKIELKPPEQPIDPPKEPDPKPDDTLLFSQKALKQLEDLQKELVDINTKITALEAKNNPQTPGPDNPIKKKQTVSEFLGLNKKDKPDEPAPEK